MRVAARSCNTHVPYHPARALLIVVAWEFCTRCFPHVLNLVLQILHHDMRVAALSL